LFSRLSYSSSGKFSSLGQLSKESISPFAMWISTKQTSSSKMILSSHRFNEIYAPIDNSLYTPSGMLSSYRFDVLPGSICFSLSSVHGSGLSIFEIASESIFSIITRDKFGNSRTEELQNLVFSIIYDSNSKPNVVPTTLKSQFSEVSIQLNAETAIGHCNHVIGAHIGMCNCCFQRSLLFC
jgi:hypothetical protein